MRRRAESWRAVFGAVLLLGVIGSFLIARAAGSTTDVFGQTTRDASTQVLTFVISAFSTLLFAAPFLAFSQIIEGQADLYES